MAQHGTSKPDQVVHGMVARFAVRIAGDDLVFSAAHFLAIAPDQCEPLHGHNYRVSAELFGALGQEQYVVDFAVAKDALRSIILELDHQVLLPAENSALIVNRWQKEIEVSFAGRRWVFPADDCLLLPLSSTTAELLARYIGSRLVQALVNQCRVVFSHARVTVEESPGLTAVCVLEPS